MLTLSKKLRRVVESNNNTATTPNNNNNNHGANVSQKRVSVRDRLLVKEFQELEEESGNSRGPFRVEHPDPNKLHEFQVTICPEEGYWRGGSFRFRVKVTDEYNFAPPVVRCDTRLWHPNISEEGDVCLSLLRQTAIDGLGWAPTRTIKDVIWGLNSLFTDLLNFDDPLNPEASEMYSKDVRKFESKVKQYIDLYCLKGKDK